MEGLSPLPAMTEHPRLVPHIDRLRAIFRARMVHRPDHPILVALSGVTCDADQSEAIRLANEHAGRFPVFLCKALPSVLDPAAAARIDERIVSLEGTLGLLPWSCDGHSRLDPCAGAAMSERVPMSSASWSVSIESARSTRRAFGPINCSASPAWIARSPRWGRIPDPSSGFVRRDGRERRPGA